MITRPLGITVILLGTSVVVACTNGESARTPRETARTGSGTQPPADTSASPGGPSVEGVPLDPIPARARRVCDDGGRIEEACPRLVPVTAPRRPYLVETFGRPGGPFQVLEMSAGAPRYNNPAHNRPPAVAHVVIEAGDPDHLIDLPAGERDHRPLDELVAAKRDGTVTVEHVAFGDERGVLVLAPSFPAGGAHGDHLVFSWTHNGTEYRVSLHAWTPADEAVATLEAIVTSLR